MLLNSIISNMELCSLSFAKLETFFGLLILCVPICAINESVGNALSYDKILIELTKRLGNSNNYRSDASNLDGTGSKQTYGSDTNNQAKCEQTLRSGVIIKATESIKFGAEYIDSIKDVSSNDICTQYCCQNNTCDVAVYQDKGDRFCYLFKCDGKCVFKDHAGYFVSDISPAKKLAEQTEEELHSLNNDPAKGKSASEDQTVGTKESPDDVSAGAKDPAPVKNVQEATSKSASLPPSDPVITPHSVGLKGYCTQSMQCEDPNAACIDHNCFCKSGYYSKDGLCRKVCLPASFECFELGTLSRGPECISREQVCDSYMHCADGSDEFNCENLVSSDQANDLSKLAGSKQTQSVQQPAGGEPAHSSKPTQHQSPAAAEPNLHSNPESKTYLPQQSSGFLSDKVSQTKNGVNHAQKPPLPSANDLGLEMVKNENSKPDSQQPEKTNPDNNSFDNTDNHLAYDNSNLNNYKSTNINNKNIGHAHEDVSGHSLNQSPRQSVVHDPSQSKPAVNRIDATENRTFDYIGHNRIPPSDQDSQPSRSKVQDSQENHELNEDSVHDHSDSLNGERLHSPEEDAVVNENSNKLYNKQTGESELRKVPAPVSHAAAAAKPSHSNSPDDEQQSLGNLKTPILLGPGKASHQPLSKSHASSVPSSYNSQKWLDSGLYMPYSLSDASNQRQKPPQHPSSSGQYFDASQYYPPYASDNLDANSLLGNLGSPDDFSQYGGTYLDRDKPLSNAYQAGGHNAGYLNFPDTAFGSQYPGSNRYDYSGEYRSPAYHESDFYPAGNSPQQYRPSAGLYEDFPSGQQRLVKTITNTLDKSAVKSVQPQSDGSSNDGQNHRPVAQGKVQRVVTTASVKAVITSTVSTTTTKPKPQQSVATTAKPSRPHGNEHVFMSSEKVIIASSTSNAEGPIIALSLGLAFTIILLALVVYRLRRMRHRLKKGRPLHQNEADYLINGMYL